MSRLCRATARRAAALQGPGSVQDVHNLAFLGRGQLCRRVHGPPVGMKTLCRVIASADRTYKPPAVRRAALVDNAAKVKWHLSSGARPLAIVKGNAYGHGLDTAAKAFLDGGFQELGVADINEAITLRQVGSTACTPRAMSCME